MCSNYFQVTTDFEKRAEVLLKWIHRICTTSDGLTSIVIRAMCAQRSPSLFPMGPFDIPILRKTSKELRACCEKYLNKRTMNLLYKFDVNIFGTKVNAAFKKFKEQLASKFILRSMGKYNQNNKRRKTTTSHEELKESYKLSKNRLVHHFIVALQEERGVDVNAFLKKIDLTYGGKYKETTSLLQRLVENNSNLHKSLSFQ